MSNIWEARRDNTTDSYPWRDPYARDRARIIHSYSFRRLQGKTQVLGLGESDFYRTRLTHSIEVAQIASGIVEYLEYKYKNDQSTPKHIYPSINLIEAISLAHDIGHPPFGHGGEVALNYMMRQHGGFEGNAQTLRIATKLGESSKSNGLNLTRRTLLGLIKYPYSYTKMVGENNHEENKAPMNISSFKPPKCIYDCDEIAFNFVCEPFEQKDKLKFTTPKIIEQGKHKKPNHKSFDTSIMELADDIAYGIHDLEDAIALKLVTKKQWDQLVCEKLTDPSSNYPLSKEIIELSEDLFSDNNFSRKKSIGKLVGSFIGSTEIIKQNIFTHDLLDYKTDISTKNTLELIKEFVRTTVIKTPEVQTLEYKGQQMLMKLFEALESNPETLLHKKYYNLYKESGESLQRQICDYLAGTTDDYATKLYHKIFTPSTGSIFDRI